MSAVASQLFTFYATRNIIFIARWTHRYILHGGMCAPRACGITHSVRCSVLPPTADGDVFACVVSCTLGNSLLHCPLHCIAPDGLSPPGVTAPTSVTSARLGDCQVLSLCGCLTTQCPDCVNIVFSVEPLRSDATLSSELLCFGDDFYCVYWHKCVSYKHTGVTLDLSTM